jgi:hypothetical protein
MRSVRAWTLPAPAALEQAEMDIDAVAAAVCRASTASRSAEAAAFECMRGNVLVGVATMETADSTALP